MKKTTTVKTTGRGTYISWGLKVLAAIWAISAGTVCLWRATLDWSSGSFIVMVTLAIAAPGTPIDIAKIKQA